MKPKKQTSEMENLLYPNEILTYSKTKALIRRFYNTHLSYSSRCLHMSESKIEIKITKSPDFKLVYTNGVFGGLSPLEGRMVFYADRLIPQIVEGEKMQTGSIERELQVEVKMSPQQFISISRWMEVHINRLKKEGTLKIEEKES